LRCRPIRCRHGQEIVPGGVHLREVSGHRDQQRTHIGIGDNLVDGIHGGRWDQVQTVTTASQSKASNVWI
jgi:hypothetical protein